MLIKEYRIPMPMSVEEYRIAQLYMIQVITLCVAPCAGVTLREVHTFTESLLIVVMYGEGLCVLYKWC